MAAQTYNQLNIPAWSLKYGWIKCEIRYRVRFVRERWRRLLALVFAALIALIIGAYIVALEPIDSAAKVVASSTVISIGITFIALIFGIEINGVELTRDGALLDFGEMDSNSGESND